MTQTLILLICLFEYFGSKYHTIFQPSGATNRGGGGTGGGVKKEMVWKLGPFVVVFLLFSETKLIQAITMRYIYIYIDFSAV